MDAIASQITSLMIVHSIVYSDADQRKHQSSASLAFVRGIHRGPGNSLHKWPVTRKMFPFRDVIMRFICAKCHKNPKIFLNIVDLDTGGDIICCSIVCCAHNGNISEQTQPAKQL